MESGSSCTLLIAPPDKVALPSVAELQTELESQDVAKKVEGLKKAILMLLGGEDMPRTLMTVIRYCITSEDHMVQKLLMLYWEVARKYDAGGKLLPEMILVCNALRNNLIHPNEYIRGCTLRFLCKLREPELLEPLVPTIKNCLSHRHPYVRRNAVLAVYSVYRHFKDLYPDAPEEVEKLLEDETDPGTRRNAFLMMFNSAQDRAVAFLTKNMDKVLNFGDGFALILLDLIRKVVLSSTAAVAGGKNKSTATSNGQPDDPAAVLADPAKRAKFIRVVVALLDVPSLAVTFEAASTLTSLSAAPSAVRAAAGAYLRILQKESDNNVRLIVLDRLAALRKRHGKVLREMVMDILRSLTVPNNDVRKRVLDIVLDLVTPRNIEEVMGQLKKEILSTAGVGKDSSAAAGGSGASSSADPEAVKYRTMLVGAIHGCAVRFPEIAASVVPVLMDFLAGDGALSVAEFLREIIETSPGLRPALLARLRDTMPDIRASDVFRTALWMLGQYSDGDKEVHAALHTIRECIGPLPLTTALADYVTQQKEKEREALAAVTGGDAGASEASKGGPRKPAVLADGTYATQSAVTETTRGRANSTLLEDTQIPALRTLLLAGDYFLGAAVASTLTKLALRVAQLHGKDSRQAKSVSVDALMVMCALVELGSSGLAGTSSLLHMAALTAAAASMGRSQSASARPSTTPGSSANGAPSSNGARIDQDSFERIVMCMRVLGDPQASGVAQPILLHSCKDTFRGLLADRRTRTAQALQEGVSLAAGVSTAAVAPVVKTAATSKMVLKGAVPKALASSVAAAATPTEASVAPFTPKAHVDDALSCRLLLPPSQRGLLEDAAALAIEAGAGGTLDGWSGTTSTGATSAFAGGAAALTSLAAFLAPGVPYHYGYLPPTGSTGAGSTPAVDGDAPRAGSAHPTAPSPAAGTRDAGPETYASRLSRIHQLTGLGDPVYAEAYIRVLEYDISVQVMVINRTDVTLTNVSVELACMGDLRLVDRPQPFTLGPRDFRTVSANIKVSSTESGHIFGTVVYDHPGATGVQGAGAGDRSSVVNLKEVGVDILDYITPCVCSDAAFRSMWADFEWENKVTVNTNVTDLHEFVQHIARVTNMRILTPIQALAGAGSHFLAANLYARSTFGEDALVNISVENKADGAIRGHIRIRAKTQGVALSLGDRITSKQKL